MIRLQARLIESTEVAKIDLEQEIVDHLSTAVQNSAEHGITKAYSEVARSSAQKVQSAVISKETLKTVAKELAVEEELSRNIVIFGLPEENDELLSNQVSEVFENLGQKPKFEANRLGKRRADLTVVRPVKISLPSYGIVENILSWSNHLRPIEKFRSLYLSPDRTPEQRSQHKELVFQLKEKRTHEPQKTHIIDQRR